MKTDTDDVLVSAMQAALRRRTMLLERVLQCGLNEEPHGVGFTPSRQERIAGDLARDISNELRNAE